MNAREKLSGHLQSRITELVKLRAAGTKIVGYSPGGFMPQELVHAAGAIPICLIRGGDSEPMSESLAYLPRFLDTFYRSQIGYWALGEEALYHLPDLLITPITDCNSKVVADCFDFYTDIEVYRIGIPHHKGEDAFEYYLGWLQSLKEKLEDFTGNEITEEKLREEIDYGNRVRSLFNSISMLRKGADSPINSQDFVWWHHASYYADKDVFLECLEALYKELLEVKVDGISKRPRLMLIASTLAHGDNRLFEIIEETDAEIVFEEVAEGLRPYLNNVELNGSDPLKAMAETYLLKRLPAPWDRPWGDRIDRLIERAKEFEVDGVIWYQLMYRDGYDMQEYWFEEKLREATGIPTIKIESDYTVAEKGPMRTRVETFIEVIQGG